MKQILKYFTVLLFCFLIIGNFSCQKKEIFFSGNKIKKYVKDIRWKRTFYNEETTVPYEQYWVFQEKGNLLVIRKNKLTSVIDTPSTGTYLIHTKIFSGTINVEWVKLGDPTLDGKWDILYAKKGILRLAKKGREDDHNPTTREGGLILLEFEDTGK